MADFSEADYLNRYPDVADAVTKGIFPNGYMHFLQSGVFELRNPSRHIDLRSYWEHNDAVRRAVRSGIMRDAFAHVLTAGRRMAVHADNAHVLRFPEEEARALFATHARDLLPLYGRRQIDFTMSGPPVCSVIMVLRNDLPLALQAIASLRQNHPGNIELILVDPGSVDDVRQVERYVIGATLLQFKDDIGFVAANNVALGSATATGCCTLPAMCGLTLALLPQRWRALMAIQTSVPLGARLSAVTRSCMRPVASFGVTARPLDI